MFHWADGPRRAIDAVLHELRYRPPAVLSRWKRKRARSAKRKLLRAWFDDLRENPPDVLMGANIALDNGVRFHMEGIRRHSSKRVVFSPTDELLSRLSYHELAVTFRDELMAFDPRGIRVVHSHVYPYYVKWCRHRKDSGPLWVHTYHSPYFAIDGRLKPWQSEINDTLINDARHAHVRISVSRWQQQHLRDNHGIETIHIPNGVDVELCDRADAEKFRVEFGFDRFVLFVGRNEPVKNPRAFLDLARAIPDLKFVAVGDGMTAESLKRSFGGDLPHNLVPLGARSREQVQDALAACSAVVVTSEWEGLPTVVLEALLREKQVVVPDNAGCVESTGDGRFAFVYASGDVADLTTKTLAALSSPRPQDVARQWVLDNYDWKVVAPKLDEIYSRGRET